MRRLRDEFQANYDRRIIHKKSETIESQQEELHRAQAEELYRRNHWCSVPPTCLMSRGAELRQLAAQFTALAALAEAAFNSDDDWDALLDAHGLAPPPGGAATPSPAGPRRWS